MKPFLQLIRLHHWSKNLFVFVPLFFAGKALDIALLARSGVGFFFFSLCASAIYIINDIADAEFDKRHPNKRFRPIPSGAVSRRSAVLIAGVLFGVGISGSYFLDQTFGGLLFFYVGLNFLYSAQLKRIAIVDVMIISIGFVIRVYSGGVLTGIVVSNWLVIMVFLLASLLALSKRRDDVVIYSKNGERMRESIDGYSVEFLNAAMVLMAAVTLVSYIMYTVSREVIERIGSEDLFLTAFFVILGLLRYLHISLVQNRAGSPTLVLMKDLFLQLVIVAWVISFGLFIYVG